MGQPAFFDPVCVKKSDNITSSDGKFGPDGSLRDVVTCAQSVSDPITGYLNLKVSYNNLIYN